MVESTELKTEWKRKQKEMFKWTEQVSDCCLMPTHQFFSYIMARTS